MLSENKSELLKKERVLFVFWLVEIAVILEVLNRLLSEAPVAPTIAVIFYGVIFLSVYFFCYKDMLSKAANTILLLTTALILVLAWIGDGVRDEIIMVYPALAAFAILLGLKKQFNVIFVIMVIYVLLLGVLGEQGYKNFPTDKGNLNSALIITVIIVLTSLVMRKMAQDLTSALDKLEEYKEQLEHRVEVGTQDLLKSKVKLEEAERMASLGRLVAGVAHEINTPIGVALTASSNVMEKNQSIKKLVESGRLKKSEMTAYIESVESNTNLVQANLDRASQLVTDFKQVAVFNVNERKSEFILQNLLQSIVNSLQPVLHEANASVSFSCSTDITMFHDQAAFTQVMTNLIVNSCRHGFEDKHEGAITINVKAIQTDPASHQVEILYQDDGKGFSQEVATHIFEPFFTTKRNKGGTGLGMHIVFNIVTQSLGGSIEVVQDINHRGAQFIIKFPTGL
ncbi:MAG: HAMP domain-containing histidine kinase [Gammaproteobacteria bacterium]|nr:HAMP domain-containing histidine kinase [Gammaproteobacteria bacterium]